MTSLLDSLPPVEQRLSRTDVARLLGKHPACITHYALEGFGKSGIKLASYVSLGERFYVREDVDRFFAEVERWRNRERESAKRIPPIRETKKRRRELDARLRRHRVKV